MKKALVFVLFAILSTGCSFSSEEYVIPVIEETEIFERQDESVPSIIGPTELPDVNLIQPSIDE